MLHLEGLSKSYAGGDPALSDVTLTVPKGEILGLIGPSGAGKSTLIRCINRLVEPTTGAVRLGDEDLAQLGKADLRRARRRIGMIFQEYALVERLTVMENVLSGRLGYVPFWRSFLRRYPARDVQQAYRLLDRVGLMDNADSRADAEFARGLGGPVPLHDIGGRAEFVTFSLDGTFGWNPVTWWSALREGRWWTSLRPAIKPVRHQGEAV